MTVHSGTTANSTTVVSGGMTISSGGTANYTIVSGGMTISSGGTANYTTVSGGMTISFGGTANHTTVSGGRMTISFGGTANSTTLSGVRYISSSVCSTYMYISRAGTANSTMVNSGGYMVVSSGGTANSTMVNSGGIMVVSSGGTAVDIIEDGGGVWLDDNATANFVSHVIEGRTINNRMTVHSGTTANSIMVNSNVIEVCSGGSANSIMVNSGGYMAVSSGGTANSTTVFGRMYISCCGRAIGTVVNEGGGMNLQSGGTANGTTVNSDGQMTVCSGGTASSVTLKGGTLTVSNGGHVKEMVYAGGEIPLNNDQIMDKFSVCSPYALDTVICVRRLDFLVAEAEVDGAECLVEDIDQFDSVDEYSISVKANPEMEEGRWLLMDGIRKFSPSISVRSATDDAVLGTISLASPTVVIRGYGTYTLSLTDCQLILDYSSEGIAIKAPTVTASSTELTNLDVTLTATFAEDAVVKEYSFDNESWMTYTDGVTMGANGTVYFRAGDGTEYSRVVSYTVSNIDKVAPDKPVATAGTTALTNENVMVTATFSGDSAAQEYSLDGTNWQSYTSGVVMTANGTVHFRGIDAAGNVSEVTSVNVANIDKVAPEAPIASVSTTEPTNQDVTVTATFSGDSTAQEYSLDGTNWQGYTSGVVMSANGTVHFRGIDAAGNVSEVTSVNVTNIDKVAPDAPTALASTTEPTNQDVTITAMFSGDSAAQEYSLDGTSWQGYTAGVVMIENGTVHFRGIDAAGNVSEVTSVNVANIDKVAPDAPTAVASTTALTNEDVTVTATFSGDSVVQEYSLDGTSWQGYTSGVVMTANGTVHFRGIDAAGNVSEVTSYAVTNIDKVAPDAPAVVASTTEPTNQDVTVTATFSSDSVGKQYSTDGSSWNAYTSGVVMTANGTVHFRGIDAAGNVSEVTSVNVANIDKVAPDAPAVVASTTEPTNQDVTVTATFSSDSVKKQYSTDGSSWQGYTSGVVMTANGTVHFRGIDAAGNVSEVTSVNVANIDKVAPDAPTAVASTTAMTNEDVTVTATFSGDSVERQYSTNGSNWNAYTGGIVMSGNGTVYFRGIDAAGNVSEVASYAVTNIDKVVPDAPVATADVTAATRGNVTVTATFSGDSVYRQYSLDGTNWSEYETGILFEENGEVYFRGVSSAGTISNVTAYTVSNIDRVAPDKPVATASTTEPTNEDVTVTATFSGDSVERQYSTNGSNWNAYTGGIVMSGNGTVYFRGIDAAGNVSEITSYMVTNIDKVAPDAPTALASTTEPTNQDVTVTATFSGDSVEKQYSTDGTSWQGYTSGVVISANGTVHFRGIDAAGNVSEVTSVNVANIDKVAPDAPTAVASTTEPTNQDVTVTATFSSDSVEKQYSLDGTSWQGYTSGVVMTANGTVHFRGIDAAGNVSDVTSVNVANIDKVAPEKPTATASTTALTNEDVTVTATFSGDSVERQYSTNGSNWNAYTGGIVMSGNGTVYFRGIDAAGNVSEVASYAVTNIDKVVPDAPTAVASTTEPTNQDVTVTATFSGDSVYRQYSLDGTNWSEYETGILFEENGEVYFRGVSAAGTISNVTAYTVSNIDKLVPTIANVKANTTEATNQTVTVTAGFADNVAVAAKEYRIGDGGWQDYTTGVVVSENAVVTFRATDTAGNTATATYAVTNIDKTAPAKPTATASTTQPTRDPVSVTATFSSDSKTCQYSWNGTDWLEYSGSVVLKENGSVYFRGIDAAGNISETTVFTVDNINKVVSPAPVFTVDIDWPTHKAVTITAEFAPECTARQYSRDGKIWRSYTKPVTVNTNTSVFFRGKDAYGDYTETAQCDITNIVSSQEFDGHLGGTDVEKSFVLTTEAPGYYGLTGSFGTLNASVTIMDGKKKVASGTVKKGVLTFNSKKNVLLDGDVDYTILVKSADKGKTASDFSMTVSPATIFGPIDNSDDVWTMQELPEFDGEWTDWAGYGDAVDYRVLELDVASRVAFDVTATDAAKFTVWREDAKTGKLKSVQATAAKANKAKTEYAVTTKDLLLDKGTYYLSVEATNAKKGGSADYTVSYSERTVSFDHGDNTDDVWTMRELPAFSGEWEDWAGYGDAVDYRVLDLDVASRVSFDVTATDATKFTIWKEDAKSGKLKSVQATSTKANKAKTEYTATTKDLLLDKGTYYLSVEATNAKKGGSADYTVSYGERTVAFDKGYNEDDTWNGDDVMTFGGEWEDWTGYGDAVDFRMLELDTAACLNFDVVSSDAAKFTIWQLDEKKGKLKSLQSTSLKANKAKTEYTVSTKELMVTAGTYYLSVECTSAKKGGSADYTVSEGGLFTRFPEGDNTNDTWKAAATQSTFGIGESVSGWVGFGDAADFFEFEVEDAGKLSLTFDEDTEAALKGKEIKITCLDAKGKNVSLAKFNGESINSSKALAEGVYYLGIACTNVKKYNTSYNMNMGMLAG